VWLAGLPFVGVRGPGGRAAAGTPLARVGLARPPTRRRRAPLQVADQGVRVAAGAAQQVAELVAVQG
jgi:hypothetical protein